MDFDYTTETITPDTTTVLTVNSSGAIVVPKGTTVQRPLTPVAGMVRLNTTGYTAGPSLEIYDTTVSAWHLLLDSTNLIAGNGMSVAVDLVSGQVTLSATSTGGGSIVYAYRADTNQQSAANPGTGNLRWNNVSLLSATQLYISAIDDAGVDLTPVFSTFSANTVMYIQDANDSTIYQIWKFSSVTNNTGWFTFGATLLGSANFASISNNHPLNITFSYQNPNPGTVTSVDVSGDATGLTFTGGPVTTSGIITLGGTLNVAHGGTSLSTTPANGQLLIGNGTGYTLSTLTAGSGITVGNTAGTITLANSGILSVTGTTNQITASTTTGATTLSTPVTFVAPGYVSVTTGLYQSTVAGITATGATQGSATALTSSYNVVTTTTAGSGVRLPAPLLSGWSVTIVNRGANTLNIYPNTGGAINNGSTNAAITLAINTTITVTNSTTTAWFTTGMFGAPGTGTVTSVSLAMPSIFTVSGSPVTTLGTLTSTLSTQTANTVFAGPTTGAAAVPTFRTLSLATNDISDISVTSITPGQTLTWNGTTWANSGGYGTGGFTRVWSGNIAAQSGTTLITPGTTVPLVTDGTSIMSQTITPPSTSARYMIVFTVSAAASTNNNVHSAMLFRGSTYIGSAVQTFSSGGNSATVSFSILDAPATTSPVTYSVRYGTSANTWYINRRSTEITYGGLNTGWNINEF